MVSSNQHWFHENSFDVLSWSLTPMTTNAIGRSDMIWAPLKLAVLTMLEYHDSPSEREFPHWNFRVYQTLLECRLITKKPNWRDREHEPTLPPLARRFLLAGLPSTKRRDKDKWGEGRVWSLPERSPWEWLGNAAEAIEVSRLRHILPWWGCLPKRPRNIYPDVRREVRTPSIGVLARKHHHLVLCLVDIFIGLATVATAVEWMHVKLWVSTELDNLVILLQFASLLLLLPCTFVKSNFLGITVFLFVRGL